MKVLKIATIAGLIICSAMLTHAQTADEIIQQHVAAMGGRDKLKTLNTVYKEGNLEVQGMSFPIKQWVVNHKAYRMDVEIQGTTGTMVMTKDSGWSFMPFMGQDKPQPANAEQVKSSQSQLDASGSLADYKEKGYQAEYLGKDTVNGAEMHKLKVNMGPGLEATYFIDAKTFYVTRIMGKATVQGQSIESESAFSNYRQSDEGYVFAHTFTSNANGGITINFDKIEVNKPIDESLFKMPVQ